MEAEEKANELVGRMFRSLNVKLDQKRINDAKQCALICVNEIQKTTVYDKYYWEQVKQEIEKL